MGYGSSLKQSMGYLILVGKRNLSRVLFWTRVPFTIDRLTGHTVNLHSVVVCDRTASEVRPRVKRKQQQKRRYLKIHFLHMLLIGWELELSHVIDSEMSRSVCCTAWQVAGLDTSCLLADVVKSVYRMPVTSTGNVPTFLDAKVIRFCFCECHRYGTVWSGSEFLLFFSLSLLNVTYF